METLGLVLRVGLSLACVLGLVWLLSKGMARGGRRGAGVAGSVQVLARQSLSRAGSLAVVRVGERALVVGVTEQQVTLLGETDLGALQGEHAEHDPHRPREVRRQEAPQHEGGRREGALPEGVRRESVLRAAPRREAVPLDTVVAADVADDMAPEQRQAVQEAVRRDGPLAGSALSPATWSQALEAIRERTTRR